MSHLVADLGWVDLDLGSSPWLVGCYCSYLLPRQGGQCNYHVSGVLPGNSLLHFGASCIVVRKRAGRRPDRCGTPTYSTSAQLVSRGSRILPRQITGTALLMVDKLPILLLPQGYGATALMFSKCASCFQSEFGASGKTVLVSCRSRKQHEKD